MKNSKFNQWCNKHADALYAVEKTILYITLPMTELVVFGAVGKFLPKGLSSTARKIVQTGATIGITCSLYGLTPLSIADDQDNNARCKYLADRQSAISDQIRMDYESLAEVLNAMEEEQ